MTIYKILCEVKWLHEYYLTLEKGERIFDKAAQTDRMDFLFSRFEKDLPSIHEDLDFVVHAANPLFDDHGVKLLPAYAGFKIAVKCRKEKLSNGTVVYRPFIDLPDDLCLRVMIRNKHDIRRYSSVFTPNPFQPSWYFSSNNIPAVKTFPFLTAPIPAYTGTGSYLQSELTLKAGVVSAFQNNGAADPWLALPGNHYVNRNDARLLPLSFKYRFNALDNMTDATVVLKDSTAAVVRTLKFTADKPMTSIGISFRSSEQDVDTLEHHMLRPDQLYRMEVTGSGGYTRTFTDLLFANDALALERYAGVLDILVKPANAAFQLLDGSGLLHTRIQPNGTRLPAPVFELWMTSKLAYWQYMNNHQRKFKLTPQTSDLLADNSGILVTKNPIPMSFTPVTLKKPDNSFQLLPNPHPALDAKYDQHKFILTMQTPSSTLFPLL